MPNGFPFREEDSDRVVLAAVWTSLEDLKKSIKEIYVPVQASHEERLRSLEKFRWMAVGMWLVAVGVAGWVAKSIPWQFLWHNQ